MFDRAVPLQVRGDLYVHAVKLIGDLEANLDDNESFDIHSASHKYFRSEDIKSAFDGEVGRTPTSREYEYFDRCLGGVMYPTEYNENLGQALDLIDRIDHESHEAAALAASVVFSFVTAWCHRYGGFGRASSGVEANGVTVRMLPGP